MLTIIAVFVISSFAAQTALAAPNHNSNVEHGTKAKLAASNQSSTSNQDEDKNEGQGKDKNKDGTRPGWGHGDKNHEHTGPPGQSNRPGQSGRPNAKHQGTFASSVNIFAEAGSKVAIYIFNGISQMFHFSA